jgi:hypothetical protein
MAFGRKQEVELTVQYEALENLKEELSRLSWLLIFLRTTPF